MSTEPGLNTDVLWTSVPQIEGSGLSSESQPRSYFLGHGSREALENRFIVGGERGRMRLVKFVAKMCSVKTAQAKGHRKVTPQELQLQRQSSSVDLKCGRWEFSPRTSPPCP